MKKKKKKAYHLAKRLSMSSKSRCKSNKNKNKNKNKTKNKTKNKNKNKTKNKYNPNFWIEHLTNLPKWKNINIVYTDVRFGNEADFITKKGGIIVRIVRPKIISGNHESELKQSEVAADIEIVNNGTIEDLHNKIRNLIK